MATVAWTIHQGSGNLTRLKLDGYDLLGPRGGGYLIASVTGHDNPGTNLLSGQGGYLVVDPAHGPPTSLRIPYRLEIRPDGPSAHVSASVGPSPVPLRSLSLPWGFDRVTQPWSRYRFGPNIGEHEQGCANNWRRQLGAIADCTTLWKPCPDPLGPIGQARTKAARWVELEGPAAICRVTYRAGSAHVGQVTEHPHSHNLEPTWMWWERGMPIDVTLPAGQVYALDATLHVRHPGDPAPDEVPMPTIQQWYEALPDAPPITEPHVRDVWTVLLTTTPSAADIAHETSGAGAAKTPRQLAYYVSRSGDGRLTARDLAPKPPSMDGPPPPPPPTERIEVRIGDSTVVVPRTGGTGTVTLTQTLPVTVTVTTNPNPPPPGEHPVWRADRFVGYGFPSAWAYMTDAQIAEFMKALYMSGATWTFVERAWYSSLDGARRASQGDDRDGGKTAKFPRDRFAVWVEQARRYGITLQFSLVNCNSDVHTAVDPTNDVEWIKSTFGPDGLILEPVAEPYTEADRVRGADLIRRWPGKVAANGFGGHDNPSYAPRRDWICEHGFLYPLPPANDRQDVMHVTDTGEFVRSFHGDREGLTRRTVTKAIDTNSSLGLYDSWAYEPFHWLTVCRVIGEVIQRGVGAVHRWEPPLQPQKRWATMMSEWLEAWKASDLARGRSGEPPR